MKEADLQRAALAWLALHDVCHWRMPIGPVVHSIMKAGKLRQFWKKSPLKGFPDIAGVLRGGRMFAIEFKGDSGSLRPEQREWLAKLAGAGAATAVIRSLDELEAVMRLWGQIA